MHTDRLALLRDALRAPLPEKTKFNLSVWRKETDCGTVCCAVGLAMGMPEFQAMELKSQPFFPYSNEAQPSFGRRTNFSAVAALFAITGPTASWLFDRDCYGNDRATLPTEVADRIDALIVGGTLAKAKKIVGARS